MHVFFLPVHIIEKLSMQLHVQGLSRGCVQDWRAILKSPITEAVVKKCHQILIFTLLQGCLH